MSIFITGATGFVGKEILKNLRNDFPGRKIFALVRDQKKSAQLFLDLDITPVSGDVSKNEVVLGANDFNNLVNEVEVIIHAASTYNIKDKLEDCYLPNVVGTHNVVMLAKRLKKLKLFVYISSYSASSTSEEHDENILESNESDLSGYPRSKLIAERFVRNELASLNKVLIVRPGIVIPKDIDHLEKIDGPFYFFELLKLIKEKNLENTVIGRKVVESKVIPLPFDKEARLHLVSVDFLSEAISKLVLDYKQIFSDAHLDLITFHLLSNDITVEDFFKTTFFSAFGTEFKFLAVKDLPGMNSLLQRLGQPKELYKFMYNKSIYPTKNTKRYLPNFQAVHHDQLRNITFQFFHKVRSKE